MIISRKRLLRKLELVAPAGRDSSTPEENNYCFTGDQLLACNYCFTGEQLLACNDKIALTTPLQSEFKGCVPAVLTNILKVSRSATAVELRVDGDNALVKFGNTQITLRRSPPEEFFQMPTVPKDNIIKDVAGQFFRAVEILLRSVSECPEWVEQLGVIFIPAGKQVKLFSADDPVITHCVLQLPKGHGLRKRVILPTDFCKEMLRLAKQAQTTRLALREDHALFLADDTLLFGRLEQSDNLYDLEGLLQRLMPNGTRAKMVDIPKPKFGLMLERAARVCDIKGKEVATTISVRKNLVELSSASERGAVIDKTMLPGHPNIKMRVDAGRMLKAYPWTDKILLTKEFVLMANADALHIIAAYVS